LNKDIESVIKSFSKRVKKFLNRIISKEDVNNQTTFAFDINND